eukprot:357425-Chlamydomonas_euryale.AAC.15
MQGMLGVSWDDWHAGGLAGCKAGDRLKDPAQAPSLSICKQFVFANHKLISCVGHGRLAATL